ncbi:MAG: glycosyl hydrolase family 28-related protein [Sediminibacterium sp.]
MALLSCQKEELMETMTLLPLQQGVNVMEQGAKADGVSDDSPAFEKAIRLANSLKLPVVVPAGRYRADIRIGYDGIQIVGQGQPSASFKYGSIILGSINCNNNKNIKIQHLGIDASNAQVAAALSSGDGEDSVDLNHKYLNISLQGGGYQKFNHGILCQTGRQIKIQKILVKNFYHGIALRSGAVTLDSIEAISCGFTSIIIKSAEGKNARTRDIVINNVKISGDADNPYERGGMILIQSFDNNSLTENIEINKISSRFAGVSSLSIDQSQGTVRHIKIKDVNSSYQGHDSGTACFDINGGSDILLSNCSSYQARGTGFRCSGNAERVRAEQCYESGSGVRPWWGNFSYLQLNGQEIIK